MNIVRLDLGSNFNLYLLLIGNGLTKNYIDTTAKSQQRLKAACALYLAVPSMMDLNLASSLLKLRTV